jgi:septum formation protein
VAQSPWLDTLWAIVYGTPLPDSKRKPLTFQALERPMSPLILASASPRRRDLLSALQVPFRVCPVQADETLPASLPVAQGLPAVALRKARMAARHAPADSWVLAADTAVVLGDRVFGKPRDRGEAEGFLRALSGQTHQVLTAVAFLGARVESGLCVATDVRFRPITEAQIAWYASLDEPYDKAGGYAIQGQGAFLVAEIRGSYTNVVGLPMAEVADLLESVGLVPWGARVDQAACHG